MLTPSLAFYAIDFGHMIVFSKDYTISDLNSKCSTQTLALVNSILVSSTMA